MTRQSQYLRDLGLDESADTKDVKAAWKRLIKQHHPDKGGDENEFVKVHHAYKMLTDSSYVESEARNAQGGQANLDATINLTLSFSQAFFGETFSTTFNSLYIDDEGQPVKIDKDKDVHIELEVIRLRVTPGSKSGDRVVVPKRGLKQKSRQGNLIIALQVAPHPKFQIQGADVISREDFPLDVMLTGGDIEAVTMWGLRTLTVPPGSRPSDRLVIQGAGVNKVGHQIVTIQPLYPDKQNLKENNVWKKLGIKWKEKEAEDSANEEETERLFKQFSKKSGFQFFTHKR